MISKRYQTGITAQAGAMGTRADTRAAIITALSYPIDCIEAHLQISEHGRFYLNPIPLPEKEQPAALGIEELLALIASRPTVALLLDIRDQKLADGNGERCIRLEALVREAGLIGRVQLKGLDPRTLAAVRSHAPELPFWLNRIPGFGEEHFPVFCDALVRQVRDSGAIGLHTHYRFVTRLLKQRLAASGLLLSVWDVDHERDMRRLLALPANNIVTRRISTLLELRSRAVAASPDAEPAAGPAALQDRV